MRVLAIVPARADSQRLPGKNTLPVAGRPMIEWTLDAARASTAVDAILVTSDDDRVLEIAAAMGVEHIVRRPAALATDTASSADVVLHALDQVDGAAYTTACLLQPTSPLRTAADIDGAVALHRECGGERVVSVCAVDHPLAWCGTVDARSRLHRIGRDLPHEAVRYNGAVYVFGIPGFRADPVFVDGDTHAFVMERERSVDVDTRLDYLLCDLLASRR